MNIIEFVDFLEDQDACDPALEWAQKQESPEQAWLTCSRSDWMLWLLEVVEYDRATLRLLSCDLVRRTPLGDGGFVWDLLTDYRSRYAVSTAERFANGEASTVELAAAYDAARDSAAYDAAYATAHAAADASYAAAYVAAAYVAAYVAADVAAYVAVTATGRAAAHAAAHATAHAAADASYAAAVSAARAAQCDIIRQRISWSDVLSTIEED